MNLKSGTFLPESVSALSANATTTTTTGTLTLAPAFAMRNTNAMLARSGTASPARAPAPHLQARQSDKRGTALPANSSASSIMTRVKPGKPGTKIPALVSACQLSAQQAAR